MSKPNPKTVKDVLSHSFVKEYAAYLRSTGKARAAVALSPWRTIPQAAGTGSPPQRRRLRELGRRCRRLRRGFGVVHGCGSIAAGVGLGAVASRRAADDRWRGVA